MKSNDLKLNVLSENNLSDRELKEVKGGSYWCHCSCTGPSSTKDNCMANSARGVDSTGHITCRAGGNDDDTSTTVETEPKIEP